MFERGRNELPSSASAPARSTGCDDGYRVAAQDAPLSAQEVTDEAALAPADPAREYRPWVLQRAARPAMLLHLRRYDSKSGLWMGWQPSYPHLIAVEYVGDRMLSLDFGARHFVIEGNGLDELTTHLQTATVQMVQEYAPSLWGPKKTTASISAIRCLESQ
jgi:hypothetical protein